jgi:hypothetical protein
MLWRHSVAAALTAESMGSICKVQIPPESYAARASARHRQARARAFSRSRSAVLPAARAKRGPLPPARSRDGDLGSQPRRAWRAHRAPLGPAEHHCAWHSIPPHADRRPPPGLPRGLRRQRTGQPKAKPRRPTPRITQPRSKNSASTNCWKGASVRPSAPASPKSSNSSGYDLQENTEDGRGHRGRNVEAEHSEGRQDGRRIPSGPGPRSNPFLRALFLSLCSL